jgi:hypothetical protein
MPPAEERIRDMQQRMREQAARLHARMMEQQQKLEAEAAAQHEKLMRHIAEVQEEAARHADNALWYLGRPGRQPAQMEKAAYLGVSASPLPPSLREQLRLPRGFGLLVDHVEKSSPADSAGVKQYDVLHKLDDQILINSHQLATLIRSHRPGEEVRLTVIHQGQANVVTAKLVEKELPIIDDAAPWGMRRNILEFTPDVPMDEFLRQWQNLPRPPQPLMPRRPQTRPVRPGDDRGPRGPEQALVKLPEGEAAISITITSDDGMVVTVKNKEGEVVFQGPVGTEEQRRALPERVQHLLERLHLPPQIHREAPAPPTPPAPQPHRES